MLFFANFAQILASIKWHPKGGRLKHPKKIAEGGGMNVAILRPGGFLDSFQVFDTHAEGIAEGAMASYNFWCVVFGVGLKKGMTVSKCPSFAVVFFLVKCWKLIIGCTRYISIPKHPWDCYIYLHSVDFSGKCIGKYTKSHWSYGSVLKLFLTSWHNHAMRQNRIPYVKIWRI